MRPFQSTIPLTEAQDIIASATAPLDRVEAVPLREARGRVLAHDVTAPADVPPFARAAMDGYAVRAADTAGATRDTPVRLTRVETIYTGQMPVKSVAAGLCSEVATGAPMPDGADAVVMVEETSADGDTVHVFATAAPGQNIGRQGADIRSGQETQVCLITYNFGGPEDTLQYTGRILGVDGKAQGKLELALLKSSDREKQGARKVMLRFRPSGLEPGRYALAINVKDPKSGKSSESSFPFDIQ